MRASEKTTLSNWRQYPHSQWAFQHVRQVLPTAGIRVNKGTERAVDLPVSAPNEAVVEYLQESYTDAFLLYREGNSLTQWRAAHYSMGNPHIVFSITKSITAILAAILVDEGLLDLGAPIARYLPGTRDSAYEDCTTQHLLDMTVALDFDENYLATEGQYIQYRTATGWNPVDRTAEQQSLEGFLYQLKKTSEQHGDRFSYRSPNTDLLGLILERVANEPLADLLSSRIWSKLSSDDDAYITVDHAFLARAAGGLCMTPETLLQFGIMMLNRGVYGSNQVAPEHWVTDTLTHKNHRAWQHGDFVSLLPEGSYRNCWYHVGNASDDYFALGIHGQWLYINPTTRSVIVKLSSQPNPLDEKLDLRSLAMFDQLTQGT